VSSPAPPELNRSAARDMNAKIKVLFRLSLVASVTVAAIVLIGIVFEPIDTFRRAQLTVKCTNASSVIMYKRKTAWLTSRTEFSARLIDPNGSVVRSELVTFPNWNASGMKVLETPDVYCDEKNWPRRLFSTGGGLN
jgi:hypothetical protein